MFKKIAALFSPPGSVAASAGTARPVPSGKFAIYLTDSEANTLRLLLSHAARTLQEHRKGDTAITKVLYDLSDKDQKDDPKVNLAFRLLNIGKTKIRKSREMEKRINGIIRATRQRKPT